MNLASLTKNILPNNIVVKKAKGVYFWDKNNKKYLDFSAQTLNLNFGNSPEFVKKAFLNQFEKFTFLSTRFTSEILVELANELIRIAPKVLNKVNLKLTNGSDANESAFKRVRRYRKKPMIVTFYWSHLGESIETLSTNSKYLDITTFNDQRNFINIPTPFSLQGSEDNKKECEKLIHTQIESVFKKRNDIAALILEPIMVNAGGYIFSKIFLQSIQKLCTKYKISLIFDEIQTAFGWLGTFFASQYYNVIPDLMTLGKGLASGFPLAGILMKKEYDNLNYGEDEYTYGGHPISCAIAIENIRLLRQSNLLKEIPSKSTLLRRKLDHLSKEYKHLVKEIRVAGLIASIEFVQTKSKNLALHVYDGALKRGLILRKSFDGIGPSLVLKPPLIVTKEEIKKALKILENSVEALKLDLTS